MKNKKNTANSKLNRRAWITTFQITLFVSFCIIGTSFLIYKEVAFDKGYLFFVKELIYALPFPLSLALLTFVLIRHNFSDAFEIDRIKEKQLEGKEKAEKKQKNNHTEEAVWEIKEFEPSEAMKKIDDEEFKSDEDMPLIAPELLKQGVLEEIEPDNEFEKEEDALEITGEFDSDMDFIDKLEKVEGMYPERGLEYAGGPDLYAKIVSEFATTGTSRADTIEQYYESKDYRNYTIQVHALKSAARVAGATKVSQLAAALEEAGNEENETKINNATGELLSMYRKLVADLKKVIEVKKDLPLIDEDSLKDALSALKEMAEGFDFDGVDSVMSELDKYSMPESFEENYAKLKTFVAEVARDDILLLLRNI